MTLDEIIEYMLSSVPDEYDVSVGSFFYDLLYPVAEQIYLLQNRIARLSENTFALTAEGEYTQRSHLFKRYAPYQRKQGRDCFKRRKSCSGQCFVFC